MGSLAEGRSTPLETGRKKAAKNLAEPAHVPVLVGGGGGRRALSEEVPQRRVEGLVPS